MKYRQGNGWVVSSWSDHYNCYVLSHEMSYTAACERVKNDNSGEQDDYRY